MWGQDRLRSSVSWNKSSDALQISGDIVWARKHELGDAFLPSTKIIYSYHPSHSINYNSLDKKYVRDYFSLYTVLVKHCKVVAMMSYV